MERTFTGPLHGMISEIEEFGLDYKHVGRGGE
jgi:hypothetical protein